MMRNQQYFSVRQFSVWMTFLVCQLDRMAAEYVLPVFSGYWYTGWEFQGTDACGLDFGVYTNKIFGTAESVANQLLANPPPLPEWSEWCEWTQPYLDMSDESMPPDFPNSRHYDPPFKAWEIIVAQPGAALYNKWARPCINPINGNGAEYGRITVTLIPAYVCPSGSHALLVTSETTSDDTRIEFLGYCATTPPCAADVVGRDLDYNKLASWVGHVGLLDSRAIFGDSVFVLEVLDGGVASDTAEPYPATISCFGTPDEFKQKTSYWGAKYGVGSYPLLTMQQSQKILNAGKTQSQYMFEYTLIPTYHPGSETEPALFRCDTFVQYCYEAGAGISIYSPLVAITPLGLFGAMLSFRETANSIVLAQHTLNETQSLSQLFAAPELDINTIAQAIQTLIDDTQLTHAEKIMLLLDLSRYHQHEPLKFRCLMEALAILKPAHGIRHLIELFHSLDATMSRRKLIYALYEGIRGAKAALHLTDMVESHELARVFLKEVFMTEKQYTIVAGALEYYLMAFGSPVQHLQDIINIIHFLKQDTQLSEVPYYNRTLDLFRIIILTPELQKIFLLDVLQEGLVEIGEHQRTFETVLCIMRPRLEKEIVDEELRNQVLRLIDCTDHTPLGNMRPALRQQSLFAHAHDADIPAVQAHHLAIQE